MIRIYYKLQVKLSNPQSLYINPIDNSLNIIDNNVILKVTNEATLIKIFGDYPYCEVNKTNSKGFI